MAAFQFECDHHLLILEKFVDRTWYSECNRWISKYTASSELLYESEYLICSILSQVCRGWCSFDCLLSGYLFAIESSSFLTHPKWTFRNFFAIMFREWATPWIWWLVCVILYMLTLFIYQLLSGVNFSVDLFCTF